MKASGNEPCYPVRCEKGPICLHGDPGNARNQFYLRDKREDFRISAGFTNRIDIDLDSFPFESHHLLYFFDEVIKVNNISSGVKFRRGAAISRAEGAVHIAPAPCPNLEDARSPIYNTKSDAADEGDTALPSNLNN